MTLSFFFFFFLCPPAFPADLNATGSGVFSVGAAHLTGPAGSDLNPAYEATGTVYLDVTQTSGSWQVRASRVNGPGWPDGATLSVKRLGDGDGSGEVSGGSSYIEVDGDVFFTGTGDKTHIPVKLTLGGISIGSPSGVYNANVSFSVEDNL